MMNKVYAGIGFAVVFSLAAYLFNSNQQPAPPGVEVSTSAGSTVDASAESGLSSRIEIEGVGQESSALAHQSLTEQQEKELLREYSEQAAAVRRDIDELILELDGNLSDRAKRDELKQRINSKMAEYNQYVLAVAVDAMQSQKP